MNNAITEEGQERWSAFASGNILLVGQIESADRVEHFAYMAEEGIYFVAVRSYSGYDSDNPYTLGVVLSTYYDAQEVDDRAQDAYVLTAPQFHVTGTIDNQFDVDVQKYKTPVSGRFTILLENNLIILIIFQAEHIIFGYIARVLVETIDRPIPLAGMFRKTDGAVL